MKEEVPAGSPAKSGSAMHTVDEWGGPLRDFLEEPRAPAEFMHWMRDLVPELDSPFSKFVVLSAELERDLPAEGTPLAAEPSNLFPVRISLCRKFLRGRDEALVSWVMTLVEVLNYHAMSGKAQLGPPQLSAAQELMVTRLFEAVKRFEAKGGKMAPFKACREAIGCVRFDYSGEPVQYMENLIAEKVIACWPRPEEAAVQDAVKFVPPEVREWLENPASCLLPQAAWPEKPPTSRVRANDKEWEAIVRAGVERGMMEQVPADRLFRDHNGVPILNGAGAVKKVKVIGGESKSLQRFISVLVPSNTYQVHMPGHDEHLPYLGQMAMLEIDEDEEVLIDSEDLTSCFNLFRLPQQWVGFNAFAKQVSAAVFGGPASEIAYVGMRVVPMGWINSVALMQTVVRSLVFGLSKVPETSEVSKLKWFPDDDSVSVVYLDSYDEVRKVSAGYREVLRGQPSHRHQRFVNTCNELELPLNQGKRLVGAVHGSLQGGDIDGETGTFEAAHDKKVDIMGIGAALLGVGAATEFELRHFVGKAIFAMAFRRPAMSFLEKVFVDMGRSQKGRVTLSRATLDEVYITMAVMPMLVMNLRAVFDAEVTITDASTTGGGGGVANCFKRPPDTIVHDSGKCLECGRELERPRVYPCPTGCGAELCSLGCIEAHRDGDCKRWRYVMPKFGERFSGPNAPLSHAVAREGGIEVQPPYDLLRGDDFHSQEGKEKLTSLESDPALAAEHWAPECKLFSKARGRPVTLPSGEHIAGPQPVRDAHHVMGFPWVSQQMKIQLRRSNTMALRGLRRGASTFGARRYLSVEHPYNSWLWYFSLAEELAQGEFEYAVGSNCCWGGDREKWYALLNNSPCIQEELHRPECPGHDGLKGYGATRNQDGSLHFATEEEAEYKDAWCAAYARGLRRQLSDWCSRGLLDGRCKTIQKELEKSTDRLANPVTANMVANEITDLEQDMLPGHENIHLRQMARRLSIRGTDLRLLLGDDNVEVPYPAYRWYWREVLSYAWKEERNINEGEVAAFNVMLKRRSKDPAKHELRYLAVVDSLVTRGAVSKGRSPSRALNRLLKQTAAYVLGSDQYPLTAWTISRWNFADGASRRR